MVKSQLKVFARIKPNQKYQPLNSQKTIKYVISDSQRKLKLQSKNKNGIAKVFYSHQESLRFKLEKILPITITQQQVFQIIAMPVIYTCLQGYNGTIFAYGQTGSGKTYTMSGSESWNERGIIPRLIQSHIKYSLSISFMQIYNENAYDLLNQKHLDQKLQNWSRVGLYQDDFGNIHLKNLSVHPCKSQQDGIDYLMLGNTVRQVSSTPLNQCSSRSHWREINSQNMIQSKLYLVDLAGSERVSKTNVDGCLLNEAKHINLSLTYLQQVIIALNERKCGIRNHIPYRNSLMTTILKDSLGGNCQTVMIATVCLDQQNIQQSISTLRFAQRVSLLQNEIEKNEKMNINKTIKLLEKQNHQLMNKLVQYQSMFRMMDKGDKKKKHQEHKYWNQQEGKKKIYNNVQMYFNDNVMIEILSIEEAKVYFCTMKDIYNNKMKEYLTQLTSISNKLYKYDQMICKVQKESSQLKKLSSKQNRYQNL